MKTPFVLSFAAIAALSVAACGGGSAAGNSADQLEKAADQSSPAAANVLDNAAEQIRAQNISDPNAAQAAMQAAGNAQATAGAGAAEQGQAKAPPQMGAKPHRSGDPVPPPKLQRGEGMVGNAGSNNPPFKTDTH